MKISLIVAHPDHDSFNMAIARTAHRTLQENGHTVLFHDLYAEEFDPILPKGEIARDAVLPPLIEQHCREIQCTDGIILVHPNWWGQPPAILKGWVDRILRPGVAYEFIEGDKGEGIPQGLLSATSALVFNTSNTPTDREKEIFGDPLEALWKTCILDFCGIEHFLRRMFPLIVVSTERQRRKWLEEVQQTVNDSYPPHTNTASEP